MRKSSRFWWLHGAILLSAAIGCNKNCTNGGGSCAPGGMGGPPSTYGGPVSTSGPIGGAGATMYSGSTSYPSMGAMPSGSSSGGYVPNMASQMPQGLGQTR